LSSFASRLLVVAIGAPIVLGALWLGGWWLFVLVALGSLFALHEFYAMARPLRPLVLAGFCAFTAVVFHHKFGVRNELLHFEKDLAIAGGLLVLFAHGAGRWALDAMRLGKQS